MAYSDEAGTPDARQDGKPLHKKPLPKGFKRKLLRHLLVEVGPLLVFFLTFMWKDIFWATAAYAVVTVVAFVLSWVEHRRFPVLPTVTTLLVATFAGLTLALDDAVFIKIKPTVTNGFYGLVLLGGWLVGFRLVERVLGEHAKLDERGVRLLTWRAGGYLLVLASLNEIVWRTATTEQWVLFKVFVIVACNLVFAVSQLPLLKRYLVRLEG